MTRQQITSNFSMNLEKERVQLGYTQAQMAAALEMSLSSYKNMINGISANIPLFVAYRVYKITGKLFFELCGDHSPELDSLIQFHKMPSHIKKAVQTLAEIDYSLSTTESEQEDPKESDFTCLYTPVGNMTDGMIYDSTNLELINVKKYKEIFGNQIDCAIKITSNHLHPVYHRDDILLICQQPPRDGDTGIFLHTPTHKIYLRKFYQTNPCRLEPLTNHGTTIYVDSNNPNEMKHWLKLGYVITKMR